MLPETEAALKACVPSTQLEYLIKSKVGTCKKSQKDTLIYKIQAIEKETPDIDALCKM